LPLLGLHHHPVKVDAGPRVYLLGPWLVVSRRYLEVSGQQNRVLNPQRTDMSPASHKMDLLVKYHCRYIHSCEHRCGSQSDDGVANVSEMDLRNVGLYYSPL